MIPESHPRYESLMIREKIVDGFKKGIVCAEGLLAHGRGEAFDYFLGEKTNEWGEKSCRAGAAMLLTAKKPVISVNGNAAALVGEEIVILSKKLGCVIEVNIFYHSEERVKKIVEYLKSLGAEDVLGEEQNERIPGLDSKRGRCSYDGIYSGDVIFVPLEDGDRTEALKKFGKKVISVDLNPMSRTAIASDITIVDNIVRAMPLMIKFSEELDELSAYDILSNFDNKKNLEHNLKIMTENLTFFKCFDRAFQ